MSVRDLVRGVTPEVKPPPVPTFSIRKIMETARLERVQIDKIKLAESYPFEEYEDFAMNDLIEEIRDNGVITPVLLRAVSDGFEVIDGRARYLAAKQVGETTLDAKIIECTDEEARELIAFSLKVFQRSFRDMPLTQQARMITSYYNSLKKQGKRNDLADRMKAGEAVLPYDLTEEYRIARGVGRYAENRIYGQKLKEKDVREDAAARYGLSGRNLARFARIDQVEDSLKVHIDNETIGFTAAVELSFLNARQQN